MLYFLFCLYYIKTAEVSEKGIISFYSYTKGYVLEQIKGNLFSQRDLLYKYGIIYTIEKNAEIYLEPPLIRYHYGRGPIANVSIGDADIGLKALLAKDFGLYGFLRLPTGADDLPYWDNWAPKFSNKKLGFGLYVLLTKQLKEEFFVHLNVQFLHNIGDLMRKDNLIPPNRLLLGLNFEFPYGLFFECITEIEKCGEKTPIYKNPKRAILGIRYPKKICPICPPEKMKLDIPNVWFAFECGTWGTGDPPFHSWDYGYIHPVYQWDISFGINIPIKMKKPPIVATKEFLKEIREKGITIPFEKFEVTKVETLYVERPIREITIIPESVKVARPETVYVTKVETVKVEEKKEAAIIVPKVGYKVQLGAFKIKSNAENLYASLVKEYGDRVFIEEIQPWWKVRIGPYRTRKEALSIRKTILNRFKDAFIIKSE